MLELLFPFIIPAVGAAITWFFDASNSTILSLVLILFFSQFAIIFWLNWQDKKQRKFNTIPELPGCLCGGKFKITRGGSGYRCLACHRLYHLKPIGIGSYKLVEKLTNGYTLAYMNCAASQLWKPDVPGCICGEELHCIQSNVKNRRYLCSKCGRQYDEFSELGQWNQLREVVGEGKTIPYMKSFRWHSREMDNEQK